MTRTNRGKQRFYHGTPFNVISMTEFGVPGRMLNKKQDAMVKKIYRETVNPEKWRYCMWGKPTPKKFIYKKRGKI